MVPECFTEVEHSSDLLTAFEDMQVTLEVALMVVALIIIGVWLVLNSLGGRRLSVCIEY